MEIKIITFQKKHGRRQGSIGSSIIRGDWLANHWPEAEIWTEGVKSDVMIFQKVYWSEMMKEYPGIKILDLCDPDWLTGELELVKLSKLVDAITCSSQGLYDYVSKIVDIPVRMIPDRLDLDFFDFKKKHEKKLKKVAWFGYGHNAKSVLPSVIPSLARLGIGLIIISNEEYNNDGAYEIEIQNKRFDWDTIKYDLTNADVIINPQPMQINTRFKYKSDNKTWIAYALGMPVANDLEEMERFMDPDERNKEAEKNLKFIKEKCDIKQSVIEFTDLIKLCQERKK